MKKCSKCKLEKDESEFRKNKWVKCGYDAACKICKGLEKKKWKDKNRDIYLAKQREYAFNRYHENIERERKRIIEWREKNPEIYKESLRKSAAKSYQKFKNERIKKAKEYRENNREKVREQRRNYRFKNKDYIKQKKSEYIARYPEKKKSVSAINNAIMYGKIKKPEECSICKKKDHIEGHHPNYSNHLEVIWLCRVCHNKEHGK